MPSFERLKSRRAIAALFTPAASSRSAYPIRAIYLPSDRLRVAFTVPKRRFRRAVDRNLLKRRLREAFRHNLHHLGARTPVPGDVEAPSGWAIMFIYTGKTVLSYGEIERGMGKVLRRL